MSREDARAKARFEKALAIAAAGLASRRHHGVYRQAGPKPPTPRERDVLQLLAIGHNQTVTAKLLGISHGTVRKCMTRMRRKAGTHSEAQLLDVAFEEGWIDIPFDD